MIAALLLGRKGSKGFPGKNTALLGGHPMAYYPMRAALDCHEIDKVYLSTDDEVLMELARQMGVNIIVRPQDLCTDKALGEHAYVHGYQEIKKCNPDRKSVV
jgi:CMP-N-acetylneuraminic acid synthetase